MTFDHIFYKFQLKGKTMKYTKAQHEKWLKSQGLSLKQITKRKPKKKVMRTSTNYANNYYEDKRLDGKPILKNELDLTNESESTKKEILRKQSVIRAMNMPGPRDLDYSIGEIDSKHLRSK